MRALTVKLGALVPAPEAAVTATGPLVARPGTVAASYLSEATVMLLAATPPKVTAVVPLKPLTGKLASRSVRPEDGVKPGLSA